MSHFEEHTYFNSYYYSNIISNIISREDVSLLGFISNFFEDESSVLYLVEPFDKYSAFHKFIEHLVYEFFENDMSNYDLDVYKYSTQENRPLGQLYAEKAFINYGMEYDFDRTVNNGKISFEHIEAYHDELRLTGYLRELYEKVANEVFYILFNNRQVLLNFNDIVSDYVKEVIVTDIEEEEYKIYFKRDGFLKRVQAPGWCQKAVFFRDRGRCCLCGTDVSGLFTTAIIKHFDHIVPLAMGGLNDISNIQLLCSTCNLAKNKFAVGTSNFYEFWY